jgi:hypothetical protein
MSEYGLVESILASVQWDRWKFMLSAKKLCKQDVAVISHGHRDHWPANLAQKDVALVPWQVTVPREFHGLQNIHRVEDSAQLGKLRFVELNQRRVASFLDTHVPKPHASWWLASAGQHSRPTRVLFVGDVDVKDVPVARTTVIEMSERGFPLHGILLPSFGGVLTHGAGAPKELSISIRDLAYEARDAHNIVVGALPHPIDAAWADYNASKLQSIE